MPNDSVSDEHAVLIMASPIPNGVVGFVRSLGSVGSSWSIRARFVLAIVAKKVDRSVVVMKRMLS